MQFYYNYTFHGTYVKPANFRGKKVDAKECELPKMTLEFKLVESCEFCIRLQLTSNFFDIIYSVF